MNLNSKLLFYLVLLINYQFSALELGKGVNLGCYKRAEHSIRRNLKYIQNCFDYCESQFYRWIHKNALPVNSIYTFCMFSRLLKFT